MLLSLGHEGVCSSLLSAAARGANSPSVAARLRTARFLTNMFRCWFFCRGGSGVLISLIDCLIEIGDD